jgi:hypothetical protein
MVSSLAEIVNSTSNQLFSATCLPLNKDSGVGWRHGFYLTQNLAEHGLLSLFSQSTLPLDEDMLDRLFGEEVRAGLITHPLNPHSSRDDRLLPSPLSRRHRQTSEHRERY